MLVNLQFQTEICLIYYALSTLIEKEKLRLFSKRLVVSWTQELAKINAVPCCTVISNTQNLRTNCTGRKACFILHVCRNKCSLQWIFSLFRSRYDQKCIYHIKRTIKLCDLNLHVNDSQVLVKVFNLNFIENYFNVSYAFLSSLSLSLSLTHTHTHTHTLLSSTSLSSWRTYNGRRDSAHVQIRFFAYKLKYCHHHHHHHHVHSCCFIPSILHIIYIYLRNTSVRIFTHLTSIIFMAKKPNAKDIFRNVATLYRNATFTKCV